MVRRSWNGSIDRHATLLLGAHQCAPSHTRRKTRERPLSPFKRMYLVEGLALLLIGRVPQEPELLDLWKVAWDRLIWKAMIPKVKAIEGELNRNPWDKSRGDLRP